MTSTHFNVGLGEVPRSSSRVLRPPGGGHTDIFGGDPEPPRGRRQFPGIANAEQGAEPLKPQNGTAPTQNGKAETPTQEQAAPEVSPAKPDSPAKTEPEPQPQPPQNSPTAPEPAKVEPPKAEPPKVEPPKRVRVPPGGFSSGLW